MMKYHNYSADSNDKCSYCSNIPFVGPAPVEVATSDFNRPLGVTSSAVLVPTLGMLVPGYFLLVSRRHIFGFAHLDPEILRDIDADLSSALARLEPMFGRYLVFEHTGAAGHASRSAGACINHAHLHLIPAANVLSEQVLKAFAWKAIPSLDAISGVTCPYVYHAVGVHHYVAIEPCIPSQWIRRTAASALSALRHWDWAVDPGKHELAETNRRLVAAGGGASTVSWFGSEVTLS